MWAFCTNGYLAALLQVVTIFISHENFCTYVICTICRGPTFPYLIHGHKKLSAYRVTGQL